MSRHVSLYGRVLAAMLGVATCAILGSCGGCAEQPDRSPQPSAVRIEVPTTPPPAEDEVDRPTLLDRVPYAAREQGTLLESFFERLEAIDDRQEAASATILQIGDSHTASDTSSGRLRVLLQDRFGDGGRGFAHPGVPWEYFRQEQMSYTMSGEWNVFRALYERSPGPWSVGGLRVESSDNGAEITRDTCDSCGAGRSFDRLAVHYLKQPEGGSFEVHLDGTRVDTVDTSSPNEALGVYTRETSDGPHRVTIEVDGTDEVAIFGIATLRAAGGIVHNALGMNGAQVQHYLRADEKLTEDAVSAIAPDLIVVALGPNEAFDSRYRVEDPQEQIVELLEKLEAYRDEYRSLLQRLKAGAPEAACLVLLPPDLRARQNRLPCVDWRFGPGPIDTPLCISPPPYNYGGIINAQRHAAALEGCAVWEQQDAMGGEGSFAIWQQLGLGQGDGIHFTEAGYDLLADTLYADLMSSYERWLSGDDATLETTIIFPELTTTARPGHGSARADSPAVRSR